MTEIVTVDIGGTHARFALAKVEGGRIACLGEAVTLRSADHASFATAWEAFAAAAGRRLPSAAAISIACPVKGDVLKLTNSSWVVRPSQLPEQLGVERFTIINDFAAVAHAVAQVGQEHLSHVCGPEHPLPEHGVISIVGPGTGLGVGALLRTGRSYQVLPCEGGHVDFAPLDATDDAILACLRKPFNRVSVERIVSGPGLTNIYEALSVIEKRSIAPFDNKLLWAAALDGGDSLAARALDRFCLSLGSAASDIALVHGATGLVIAGGLGLKLANHLPRSGFLQRFTAKGRFEGMMAALPVKVITHPQPGLLGAAAAFGQEHAS